MGVRRFDLAAGGDAFSFHASTEEKISFWLSKYPEERKRSAVIPLLWLAQKDNAGWLSEPAMREVADRLEMPYIRVYEVATFYTMFRLQPVGQHHIQLCGTTPCMLRGANDLKEVCEKVIGRKGQVNETGRLSWEEVECLGACVNAPVVQINDYYYEDLTSETLEEVLRKLDSGVDVAPGTFVKRHKSAPEGDAVTLVDAALYNGSAAASASLPNLPEELPETTLKPRDGKMPKSVKKAKSVKAEAEAAEEAVEKTDTGSAAENNAPEGQKPEGLEAPKGEPDDLKKISGIGPKIEGILNELGIFHFSQIAAWGEAEVAWIDDYLKFKGRVARENWIAQATTFADEATS